MSEHVRSVLYRGVQVEVDAVDRVAFKARFPDAYRALESSKNMVIPVYLHVSRAPHRLFHIDFGLTPIVHTWDGTKWVEVKR